MWFNLNVSLVEQTEDDDDDDGFVVSDGPYIRLFFEFIEQSISRLSTWICSTTPSISNFNKLSTMATEVMVEIDNINFMEHAAEFLN